MTGGREQLNFAPDGQDAAPVINCHSNTESSMILRPLLIAIGLFSCTLPALADGEVQKLITPADKARLDKYGETRKAALAEAKAGDPAEVKQLDALLANPLVAFSDKDLTGTWRCRTIKTGGSLPLVIYGWFKC